MFSWICVVLATCRPVIINQVDSHTISSRAESPEVRAAPRAVGRSDSGVDARLRELGLRLKAKYITPGGLRRASVVATADYQKLQELARDLAGMDLAQLITVPDRIAFWVNVYNALTIHGLISRGQDSLKSVLEIPEFFARTAYTVGGSVWSLDQIEHGILRANAKPPATLFRTLYAEQRERALRPQDVDPRIHFVLNCGARSCPPMAYLTPSRLNEELDVAAEGFIQSETQIEDGAVVTSKIFDWYSEDFKPSVREFLLRYSEGEVKALLSDPQVKIKYRPYDWTLD